MARGFRVQERIPATPETVWRYLTDADKAGEWMPGVDGFTLSGGGTLQTGSVLVFRARGKDREASVTVLEEARRFALTSTQGGVTATYEYVLAPIPDGAEVTLNARCNATGMWKLIHPVIVMAMKKADSPQLSNLKALIERSE